MDETPAKFDPRSGRPRKTLAQILDRFAVAPSGCWEWTGTRNLGGYGIVCVMLDDQRSTIPAHRMQWMRCHGEIPEGCVVMHLCDNPACINPEHLATATQAGNLADMRFKGRANTTGLIGSANGFWDRYMRNEVPYKGKYRSERHPGWVGRLPSPPDHP